MPRKGLAGSMMKQSFDAAAETMKQVASAPGRVASAWPRVPPAAAGKARRQEARGKAPPRHQDSGLMRVNAPLPESAARAASERGRRQAEVVAALSAALPAHALLWQREDTVPYECDGLTAYREQPLVVALPESEAQIAAVLYICHGLRGAGGRARRRHRPVRAGRCRIRSA